MWLTRRSGKKKRQKKPQGKKGGKKKRGEKARGKSAGKKALEKSAGNGAGRKPTDYIVSDLSFTSDWVKKWCEISKLIKCAEDQKSFHTISVIFDAWLNTVLTVIKVECIYFFIREVLDSWDALKSLYPIQNDSQFVLRVLSSFSLTRKKEGLGTRLTGRVSALLT